MTPKLSTILAISATAITCTAASAFAAATITGAHIKNGTVAGIDIKDSSLASIDVKNGSLGVADLSVAARDALKAAAVPGPAGAPGAQGERGLAAWDTIPAGLTVTGNITHMTTTDVAGAHMLDVALPGMTPTPLTPGTVNVAAGNLANDDDATCTGSATVPTAPAGKVCIYPYSTSGVVTNSVTAYSGILPRQGFRIRWNGTATSQMFIGTWAYTAA